MNYYIYDFCCICLSISNEKLSNKSSKYPDNLSPCDKLKTVFMELSAVMDNDNRICLKCSVIVASIYEFHKTCIKNINILNSYKKVLKENQSKKLCYPFIKLTKLPKTLFQKNCITSEEEVDSDSVKSLLNNDATLRSSDYDSDSRSSEAVQVKQEIDINYETYNEKSDTSWMNSEIKMEIEETDMEKMWNDEFNETSQEERLTTYTKDSGNISVELPEEVFVKEEILEDPLLEVAEGELPVKREHSESIGVNQSKSLQEDLIHEDKKELDCAECGETMSCKSELNTHMLIHSKGQIHTGKKSHKCDVCGTNFTIKNNLKIHMLIHTGEKPHQCEICGKFFTREFDLKRHILTHTGEKPHKCEICGRLFTQSGVLQRHMLIHTGEKPYKCNNCDKYFNQRSSLKKHMLTHTGEKNLVCDICGKLFSQHSNLNVHKLIHTGVKPHKCNICGKLFTNKTGINRHMFTHTDAHEKPHKCDVCGKFFTRECDLKIHMLTHTGEKPHKCDICGKLFTFKSSLVTHMLIHTGFKCNICDESFNQRRLLYSHMLTHIGEKP